MIQSGHQRNSSQAKKKSSSKKSASSSSTSSSSAAAAVAANPVTTLNSTKDPSSGRSSTSPAATSFKRTDPPPVRSRSHSVAYNQPEFISDDDNEPATTKKTSVARRRAASRASEPLASGYPTDVFEFLDKGEKGNTAHSRKSSDAASGKTNTRPKDRARKASLSQLLRTVSGISSTRERPPSVASSVESRDSTEYQPITPPDVPLDSMNWKLGGGTKGITKAPMAGAYITDTESVLNGPTVSSAGYLDVSNPESFYMPKSFLSYPSSPMAPAKQLAERPIVDSQHEIRPNEASRRRSRSDSLRSPSFPKADSETSPTIYRKFETLNRRIIKHLQDEIIQLEDDLSTIDELEAAHHNPPSSRNSPRQKMLAAKYQDLQIQDYSVLHYKRTDLMEKIIQKTDQYNRALCSFSKVIKSLPTASDDDIESYRNSLKAQSPTKAKKHDRRILDHREDLIVLSPLSGNSRYSNPLYATIAAIFASILLPLLAFGAIYEFFGRIVVVTFAAGTLAWWASNGPPGDEYLIDPQDGWKCAAIYFTFMSVAAIYL